MRQKIYYVKVYYGGDRPVSRYFSDKAEAQEWASRQDYADDPRPTYIDTHSPLKLYEATGGEVDYKLGRF